MKTIIRYILLSTLSLSVFSCSKEALETTPQSILFDDQTWSDPVIVTGVLANFYNRLPAHTSISSNYMEYSVFDEAIWSGFNNPTEEAHNNVLSYATDRWRLWDYGLIRDINLAIDKVNEANSVKMTTNVKKQFIAELRFLRALDYFEMVKRMGGVPIITEQLIYDFSGDATPLQRPRNTEAEVYTFVANEVDAIKEDLGYPNSKTHANKYAALALKSRAMLYAGSIAKYGSTTPTVSTPGGEVGISASLASGFYQRSLDASREILVSNKYSLYNVNPNKGENFYEAIMTKNNNPEVIWAYDFNKAQGKKHNFTVDNIARSFVENASQAGSGITPSAQLVEAYEYVGGVTNPSDGSLRGVGTGSTTLTGTQQTAQWIFYDKPEDIFANKDARLYGTVIYPGTSFAGRPVSIQMGVYVWNASTNKYDRVEGNVGSTYTDGGVLTGKDGPHRSTNFTSNSGFYLRKYIDPAPGASSSAVGSDTWWIYFRLGEILLNAGEAAFELNGATSEALDYFNQVRVRAGFAANSINAGNLDRLKIENERRIELAFEDHRVWDLRRWRRAHILWDGNTTNRNAMMLGAFSYRVVRPGHPMHGKYVYDVSVPARLKAPRFYQVQNYYSTINNTVLSNNPKIVKNPFQ